MANSRINSKSPTIKRILREAAELATSPSPDFYAAPANDADLFDWHFTLRGPPSSAFADGIYHGRIVLPATYPLRPPSFRFLTPSGRFEVNREICLSISGHHEETWMPAWGVRTALVALRSFMETDPKGQLGGMDCSPAERERLAKNSSTWACSVCGKNNDSILKESEEASKKEGTSAEEIEVPKELNMAWKDEMKTATVEEKESMAEDAALAEGFVNTGGDSAMDTRNTNPVPGTSNPQPATRPAQGASQPPARPAQGVPQPTGVTARPLGPARFAVRQEQQRSNDGVPLWVDRAIAAIVVLLVAMVLKILLGL